jgi:hypothetical protein
MNKKIAQGALAGVAAIALAAGGSTYAGFSDWNSIADNKVDAGILKLTLSGNKGTAIAPLDFGSFTPGRSWIDTIWVASSDAKSVPNAGLSVTVANIRDAENGCASTNGEKAADSSCDTAGDAGELSRFLGTDMFVWKPVTAGDCGSAHVPGSDKNIWHSTNLFNTQGTTKLIGDLNAGEGYCVEFQEYVHKDVGNQIQGDGVKFDLRFDLVQNLT